MISKKTKYALKALVSLAERDSEKPVLISELAEQEKIPHKFLEAILLDLKRHGVLQSKKGKGGGYKLGKPADEIMVGHIVRMLDGPLAPIGCVSQTAYVPCDECHDETTCGIRMVMKDVRDAIASILDSTSLAAVVERVHERPRSKAHHAASRN